MTPPLEIAANVLMTASIILAGRNNIHSWWIGIVGCVLFAVLFYQVNLYADVLLQLFFIVTCAIGWLQWRRGAGGQPLPITRVGWSSLAWIVPAGVAAVVIYGLLLHRFTNAYAPFIDSAVLVFSVIAQFLLMSRRLETWAFWLMVNTVAVPLYYSRGLTLTAVLYAAYWINALVSWYWWRLQARRAVELADAPSGAGASLP
ncbi:MULTISPECIES: nicotinamide riboside transporter PnuC [unclassified Janthinobacterium]|uniref:nicotinamide riboside transporter PnuC n=1 Tax=unclassified Janthinobacterium TaxID=2610881 RepID=UPI00160CE44B|nr:MULTISPECIES: nicotinamide riboside transporter PnuC [unclassified Janthinobacterium]MBB5605949.1 nicotinamide mononucleotide transporter [Janthinobacterium sp. S3T4]MBB5611133.1 nicotinamide mononucleotide transporter [Janthinobacterium sp. S3M3]